MPDHELHLLADPQVQADFARAEELRQRFDGLSAVQRSERYTAQSARAEATATVDGTGRVLDLRIDDHALRRGHPGILGTAIMQAISAARLQAATRAKQLITGILYGDTGPVTEHRPPETSTPAPATAVRSPRRARPVEPDDDEPFDIFAGHRPGWMRR